MGTIFDTFNKCIKKQELTEYDKFDSYMFCRWLSGCSRTIQLANVLNFYYKIPDVLQYSIVKDTIKERFIRYPSKIQNNLKEIKEKYHVKDDVAEEYAKILNKF